MNIDLNKAVNTIKITGSFTEEILRTINDSGMSKMMFDFTMTVEELYPNDTLISSNTSFFIFMNDMFTIKTKAGIIYNVSIVNEFMRHNIYLNGIELHCTPFTSYSKSDKINEEFNKIILEKIKNFIDINRDNIISQYEEYAMKLCETKILNLLKNKNIDYNKFQKLQKNINKSLLMSVLE